MIRDKGTTLIRPVSFSAFLKPLRFASTFRLKAMPARRSRRQFRQLHRFDRGRLVGKMEAGLSMHHVANRLSVSVATARRWWTRFQNGANHERQRGSRRPRITKPRNDGYLRMQIIQDRLASTPVPVAGDGPKDIFENCVLACNPAGATV